MSFCDSRWLTKDAALWRVALEMVAGGCVAQTPASSSPKHGISSGVFDLWDFSLSDRVVYFITH